MRSYSLGRELARLGHQVTLLASRTTPGLRGRATTREGVQVFEPADIFPRKLRNGGLSPQDLSGRLLWTIGRQFDVLHAFDHRPAAFLPAWFCRMRGGGILVSDWADLWGWDGIAGQPGSIARRILGRLDHFFELWVRRRVDGVTSISSDLDRRAAGLGIPADRRLLVPPGAPVDWLRVGKKQAARAQLGLPPDAHIAGYSGFAPYDREFLERVILDLLGRDPEAVVISSGSVRASLQSAARARGVGDRVIQYGVLPQDEIGIVLAASDVLMLPYINSSINRGRFPNKFGDYLAAGRAIVTHPTGDLGSLVEREKVAVLSSSVPEEYVAAILHLFESPGERAKLGERARKFAESSWSWKVRAEAVNRFYSLLLSRKESPALPENL